MKKGLIILLCLPMFGFGQLTYVPDDAFESYLENNGMGNGIANDDYVTTANINMLINLNIAYKGIEDLTGIEDFDSLVDLTCYANQLTSLDLSSNTVLMSLACYANQLISINISQNTSLGFLDCSFNLLTSLDVSGAEDLSTLFCVENFLTSLDVSQNTNLTQLNCYTNQLFSIDLRNGNNLNFVLTQFKAADNPNLTCINVDDSTWSTNNWTVANGNIDAQHYFSTNCPPSSIQEHTTNKELITVTDLLGRETKQTNQTLFYIYDDGTVEKRIIIE